MEFVFRSVIIGAGATLVMDLWGVILRRLGIATLSFAMLGRWVGNLPRGVFVHESIAHATPVEGELALGWVTHYAIGIGFGGLLLAWFGLAWAHAPTLGPALLVGVVTAVAPLFVLQPALGAGIASINTAAPVFNALKSVVTHVVFGFGLYLAAWATSP